MEISLIFALISAIIYLSGFIPYIYHVYHGRVVPHPFSWSVWAIVSSINTLALIGNTDTYFSLLSPLVRTSCLIIGGVIGWTLIRKIRINMFDYTCLILAMFTVGIAYFYGIEKAIIPTILIDLLVLSPTLKKIWIDPASEDMIAWITTAISQFFLLLSLGTFVIDVALFWIYIMSVNAGVAAFIFSRARYMRTWKYRLQKFFSIIAFKKKL